MDRALLDAALRSVRNRKKCDTSAVIQLISGYTALAPSLLALRRSGAKTLFVGTMVEPDEPVPGSLLGRLRAVFRRQLFASSFNAFVASSAQMATHQAKGGAPPERITVISNGVDTKRFRPVASVEEKAAIRTRLGLPQRVPIALFVGNIIPRKGVDFLVEAWHQVRAASPESVLVLLGPLERPTFTSASEQSDLFQFQQALFAACGPQLGTQILFPGESLEVADYFRASDLFLFPSRKEGLGNVVLEAMASGLPVVLTDYLGRPQTEFGSAGNEFVLCDSSPSAFAEAILTLLADPGQARSLGNAARNWTTQQLSLEGSLDQFAALYRNLALGPQGATF